MKRLALCALLAALLAAPAVAVGPLAMLAKEMIKGIVRQFVENRMNQMLSTAGPCGMPIAQPGAMAGLAGLDARARRYAGHAVDPWRRTGASRYRQRPRRCRGKRSDGTSRHDERQGGHQHHGRREPGANRSD